MRESFRKFQFVKSGLAAGFVLTLGAAWADIYTLESVDFASNGEKTQIVFHTGSIVPVQKVLVSNNKLILDLSQVNADETVKTNFDQAKNISHIIMQPMGEHKLRMIVRGENLGTPAIAFFSPEMKTATAVNPQYQAPSRPVEETASALQAIQEEGTQPATLNPTTDQGTELTAADTQPFLEPEILPTNEVPIEPLQPAPTSKTPVEALTAPLSLPSETATATTGNPSPFLDFKLPRHWETYIPYGILGLVLLGIIGFVAHRVIKLKQAEPALEDWAAEQTPETPKGKRGGFQEMAAAYRNKREQQKVTRKQHADDMIGLRSLKQMDIQDEPPVQPPVNKTVSRPSAPAQPEPNPTKALETLLSALQANQVHKAAAATPAPKATPPRQAVNQYLKAQPQSKAKTSKSLSEREYQESLQRELKRAQTIQGQVKKQAQASKPLLQAKAKGSAQAPINRAPAAKKAAPVSRPTVNPPSNQGPLPGNPEVLNFLRNVADLMEKDGKVDIAKSIHKNLNTHNLA